MVALTELKAQAQEIFELAGLTEREVQMATVLDDGTWRVVYSTPRHRYQILRWSKEKIEQMMQELSVNTMPNFGDW